MREILPNISSAWAFAGLILGFGFVVFVHEFGHFAAAKLVGIKVTQFAVGFGHAIVCFRKGIGMRFGSTEATYQKMLDEGADANSLGETEYRLNWVPLGGYVKMLGQDDMQPGAEVNDVRAFNRKSILARACVVSAGVVMNLIFAVLFFIVCFLKGVEFPSAVVGWVDPTGPAAKSVAEGRENDLIDVGLQTGDRITDINGRPITDFMDIAVNTALARRSSVLQVQVERAGETQPLIFNITPQQSSTTKLLSMGIEAGQTTTIDLVPRSGPFAFMHEQGVRPNMYISAVDGKPVETYGEYHRGLVEARGLPVPITFNDPKNGGSVTVEMSALAALPAAENQPANLLGLVPAVRIVSVEEDSAAANVGIHTGDHLAQIGSQRWPSTDQVMQIVAAAKGSKLRLAVWRDGQEIELPAAGPGRKDRLGIGLGSQEAIVGQILEHSSAAAVDLIRGSTLVQVNGQPVKSWSDVQRILQLEVLAGKGPYTVEVELEEAIAGRPNRTEQLVISPSGRRQILRARWEPQLSSHVFQTQRHSVRAETPLAAAALGIDKTHQFMLQTYLTLARMFEGTIRFEHLRGPVGIVHEGTRIARRGWAYLLFFLGVISVNLVVINFLPIPIVDGGLMIFLIIEKLKGSPVSPKIQTAAFFVGLALIGSIFLVTLYYDAGRLLQ